MLKNFTRKIKFNGNECLIDTFGKVDMVTAALNGVNIWEPNVATVIKLFCLNNKTTFLDIGSNIGVHTCHAKLSNADQIFSFECNPFTIEKLKNTVNINKWENVEIIGLGLSNEKNTFDFKHINNHISGSFIINTHDYTNSEIGTIIKVNVDKFNNVFDMSRIPAENKILIKMDIEGHELEALNGMSNVLSDFRLNNVIIELNTGISSFDKLKGIIDLLKTYNFITYKIITKHPGDCWFGVEQQEITSPNSSEEEILGILKIKGMSLDILFIR